MIRPHGKWRVRQLWWINNLMFLQNSIPVQNTWMHSLQTPFRAAGPAGKASQGFLCTATAHVLLGAGSAGSGRLLSAALGARWLLHPSAQLLLCQALTRLLCNVLLCRGVHAGRAA